MRLLKLTVHNFKGLADFTLEPQGKDISVMGANATGKTTLADAFWDLLFGKDSSGRADFERLPLNSEGKRVQGVTQSEIEGILAFNGDGITNGKQVTLRKVYSEVWRKKRGKSEAEFGGHETAYWIDGVPQKKGDYEAFIKGICDEERFKLITNARYFNEILDWKARRQFVLGLGAGTPDAEIISSSPELSDLGVILEDAHFTGTVDDFRKVLDAELTKTNKELNTLPVRVDEANKGLPAASLFDAKVDRNVDLDALRKERTAKQTQLSSLETTGVSEKTKTLREIEGEITNLDNNWRSNIGRQITEAQGALDQATSDIRRLERDLLHWRDDIDMQDTRIKGDVEVIQALAEEWERVTNETFSQPEPTVCYACDQPLPREKIEFAHEKAVAAFNLAKSQRIERIERDGNSARELKQGAEKAKARAVVGKEGVDKLLASAKLNQADLLKKVEALEAQQSQPSSDPKRHQLVDRLIAVREDIRSLESGAVNPVKNQLLGEIAFMDKTIAETEAVKAASDQRAKGLARIEELKAQQKALGKAFEGLEHQRILCEKFVVSKARILTERINTRFAIARFKLFDVQVNGGIADTCEVTVNGVPYSDLNNGARINAGLDIINTLGEVYGLTAPIFIDNAEAVVELAKTRGQQIRLYVSGNDPVLRVEGGQA